MLFILSFIFSCIWAMLATRIVKKRPKTCWVSIALMLVLIYYLY
nr:MAG TPA: hypothetical protein [Caudoviricetes sp.]